MGERYLEDSREWVYMLPKWITGLGILGTDSFRVFIFVGGFSFFFSGVLANLIEGVLRVLINLSS